MHKQERRNFNSELLYIEQKLSVYFPMKNFNLNRRLYYESFQVGGAEMSFELDLPKIPLIIRTIHSIVGFRLFLS